MLSAGPLSVASEQDVFQSGFEECRTIEVLPTKVIADQILIAKILRYHEIPKTHELELDRSDYDPKSAFNTPFIA